MGTSETQRGLLTQLPEKPMVPGSAGEAGICRQEGRSLLSTGVADAGPWGGVGGHRGLCKDLSMTRAEAKDLNRWESPR